MSGRIHRRLRLFTLLMFMCSVVLSATPDLFTARTVASGRARSQAATVAAPVMPTLTAPCALYPIALHAQSVAGAAVGSLLPDIWNGTQPGDFGWLTWTGTASEAALVTSLTQPGDAATYRNPDNAADQHLSLGDWVSGRPGVTNSAAVRDALDQLKTIDIAVPIWDVARASGSTSAYHVVNVGLIRIVDYALVGQDKFVSARFLGYHSACGDTPPIATATLVPSLTPSPTATSTPTSTPVPPTATRVPTTAPSSTALPTSEPSIVPTAPPPTTSTSSPTVTSTPQSSPTTPIATAPSTSTPTVLPTAQPTATPLPTLAPINQRPVVDAGPDQLIRRSAPATTLAGTVQDDGLPVPAAVTFSWSVVAGPGTVIFGDPDAASTTVQFSMSGVFHLRLTATDGAVAAHDELVVAVVGDNAAPIVDVGPDRTLGSMQTLLPVTGDVRDDGLPLTGALTLAWQQLAGPGTVTFSTASAQQTTARFSAPGTYRLRLTATDSELSGDDELTITVADPTAATSTPSATATPVPTPILTTILNSDTQPRGYYNAALGTILDGTQPQFPLANVAGGDPTINPAPEPDLTAASALLGDWLDPDPLPLTSHWSPFDIVPAEWATNTETAVIFPIDAGPYGVANLRGNFGADNGIFVWVNGVYRFGAVEPRGSYRYEYADIDLGSLHPGINYIQILREDHGGWTNSILNIQGIVLTAPPADPRIPTLTPPTMPTPAATTTPVAAVSLAMPGWIGSPANQRTVTDQVPITLIDGITLTSGVIDYWPVDRPDHRTTLARNVAGTSAAPLATLDTTQLANGSYIIRLRGTASDGTQLDSGVLVMVSGDYKPGRVRFSVTDLTIPAVGMPITIGRTYDSLERDRVGDFGYGWTLSVGSPRLAVDPAHNVTLTQPNGQRVTFYFTPQSYGGVFKAFLQPAYTPEAGVYGTLEADGCPVLTTSAAGFLCFLDTAGYQPTTYRYTDPYGRVFSMGMDGTLQSIKDLNGNTLTFTRDGITSSTGGPSVSFVRGAHDRITHITAPSGTTYQYGYDSHGDLTTVTYPKPNATSPQPVATYVYLSSHPHLYERSTDPLGQSVAVNAYYISPTDPVELDGRLKAVTEHLDAATAFTTSFTYDLAAKTITTTNPDGGRVVREYGEYPVRQGATIDLIRETVDVRANAQGRVETSTTRFAYNDQRQLIAIALPDPETGAAAALATDPTRCAPRNTCSTYDRRGNRTGVTDTLGNTTSIEYNLFNRPIRVTDTLGQVRAYAYDAYGNVSFLKDELGLLGGYTYDVHGNPATHYLGNDPSKVARYTYTDDGTVATVTDVLGTTREYTEYDAFGNPGTVTLRAHDGFGRTIVSSSEHHYNALGQLESTTVHDGQGTTHTSIYQYDRAGNVANVRDATTQWNTTYDYFRNGAVKQVTHMDGTSVHYTYTWRGDITTETDPAGTVTRSEYDYAGQLVRVTQEWTSGKQTSTSYAYSLDGQQTTQTDARGNTSAIQYDAAGRPAFMEDPVHGPSHRVRMEYDVLSRVRDVRGVNGIQTHYTYDARGFVQEATLAYGTAYQQTHRQQHDGLGHITERTDASGKTTVYRYNDAGQLVAVVNPMGQTTAYTLDGIGQVRQVIDASGHTTTYDYDRLGRVTRKVWHDQSEEQFRYSFKQPVDADPAHDQEPTAQTAPGAIYLRVAHILQDGQTNYSYYDAQSRLVRTVYVDGDVVAYAYSSVGQLASVTDQRGLTCYRYDDHQRVAAVDQLGAAPGASCRTSPSVYRVTYTYDENNNRTSVTTVIGATSKLVGYAYDANNRPCVVRVGSVPASCADTAGAYVYTYEDVTADPDHGQRTTLTYPDGIKETATYDPLGRLKHVEQQDQRSTLASYTYAFYPGNNRQSVTEGDGATTAWEYDDADRLTREVRKTGVGTPVWDLHFSYDDSGNRQEMHERIGGSRTMYTYMPNGLDQLASVTSNGIPRSYSYDGRGNLRSDGVATYSYNARNQLISLRTPDTAQTYTYDALGNRIRQTVNGTTTNYLWDEMSTYGDVLAELDSSGSMEASYVLASGTLLEQTRGTTVVHPLRDGQGNTRLAVDARAGTVTQQYVYDAFGVLRDGPSAPTTRYLYTGQQFDQDSQLYSLRERYYHPGDGRFLNRDTYPLDAQRPTQWHRYVYGANNPVNGFDPSGQLFIENVTIDKQNDEQRKAHARYHAGTGFATGPDRVALLTESVFSAVFDEIFVTGSLWAFTDLEDAAGIDDFIIRRNVAMGLGTVYHLGGSTKGRPDTITKAVTVNAAPSSGYCQWSKVATNIKCPLVPNSTAGIQAAVVSALQGLIQPMYPGSTVVPLQKESDGASAYDAGQQWKPGHAEILIARWALKEYAGPPTPHRMLDIATSIKACTKPGYGSAMPDALPCAQVLPTLHSLHPMLFEMTVFMP